MVKWNPATMFNSHNNENQDIEIDNGNRSNNDTALSNNQNREQESAHIGQTSNNAETQREPTNVFPSDFGGYILHPENKFTQSSDFVHGSDDMVTHKKPLESKKNDVISPPGYASKPELTHDEDISFFGDSNTTEPYAKSRSTLDQASLHRGSITTLPSAGNQRRGSAHSSGRRESLDNERRGSNHQRGVPISGLGGVHAPESATSTAANVNVPIGGSALPMDKKVSALPSDKLNSIDDSNQSKGSTDRKNSLSGMASAAVTGAAAVATGAAAAATGAAAALLGTNGHQYFNRTDQTNSKMPSAWPGTPKQSASDTQNSGGYILRNDSTKKDATNCTHEPSIHGQTPCFYTKDNICDEIHDFKPHCENVREPSIHGQNPSYYCEKEQSGVDPRSSIKSPAITNNDLTQPESINCNPINAHSSNDFNFKGVQDSKGIDSCAITAESSQFDSHHKAHAIAIGTASTIGTGAGIAAFNREPIDAEAIRRHSLDHTKEGIQNKEILNNEPASSQTDNSQKFGDDYILKNNQARSLSTDSGLHGVKESKNIDSNSATGNDFTSNSGFNQSTKYTGIPANELTQPSKRSDLDKVTLDEGQVPKNTDTTSTPSNAMSSGQIDRDTTYSIADAKSNNITDVYHNDTQGATSNRITPDSPSGNYEENNTQEVNKSTPRDFAPEVVTPQYQQTPKESVNDSSKSNAIKGAVAGGGVGAALSGLLGSHNKSNSQSNYSSGSPVSSSASRHKHVDTPDSNDINAIYQTNAQNVHADQITKTNPIFDSERNNLDDVYRTNAQGVTSDKVFDRGHTPTTAKYENDIRDVYRTNAEGTTQDLITPSNPTVTYDTNDIRDVYRTTPRNMTPEGSTPRYAGTPRHESTHNHDNLLASGGIAAAVGGILGVHHQSHGKNKSDESSAVNDKTLSNASPDVSNKSTQLQTDKLPVDHTANQKALNDTPIDSKAHLQQFHNVNNRTDQELHHDKLPLGYYVDQEPINNNVMGNNSHPQQMHSADRQVPKDRANDSLHPQTGSTGPAPIIAGNTANSNLPGNLQEAPRSSAGNTQESTRDFASDSLHPQTGSTGPAPIIAGNTANSNLPGNLQEAPRSSTGNTQESTKDPTSDSHHPQTGSTGPAPVIAGSTTEPSNAQKTQATSTNDNRNLQTLGSVGSAPIIAGATGAPVPGNIDRSKGSFSSTRAITDNIIPSGGARTDEVKDRSLERQNQINNTNEPKRKTSLTEGIKSAFRRMSLKSDKKPSKDGRRMSAAEAFKNQTLTHDGKSNSAPAGTETTGTSATDPSVPSHQIQQQQQPTAGFIINNGEITNAESSTAGDSVNQNYARVPGVYSLKPAGTVNVADDGKINFVKLNEEANMNEHSKSNLPEDKSEQRQGSIQNTVGKVVGNQNMQNKEVLSQVPGKDKINTYNVHPPPTNLNNL
ncbi:hypothetical protein INT46_004727 [Mucor plumbeus]|uniref:Uncharacterized protein n=1 Tax=Mucor plumbeus TaxID=97098 RepID=A0A8H7RHA0_9FUNG|nr:hypothetical protein INT46_004727 [Mucor plumbeus]